MVNKKEGINCWYMEQKFHDKTEITKELLDKNIVALRFDKTIDLSEAIKQGVDFDKYIDKNCQENNYVKRFSKIKKGDYFLYKAYKNHVEYIEEITYIGEIQEDFNNGYKHDSELAHTLPVCWIKNKKAKLSRMIYTRRIREVNHDSIERVLGYIKLENDKELIRELQESSSKKYYLNNYYYKDNNQAKDKEELLIAPKDLDHTMILKDIKKGDYVFVKNIEQRSENEDGADKLLLGICRVKGDFIKENNLNDFQTFKLDIEWVREPKVEDYKFISTTDFLKLNKLGNFNNVISNPLNTILYGPPGTGKTYNVSNEALKKINYIWYMTNFNKEGSTR